MNTEILNLAESVTKLELQVRTRFLKLMLSTQNTDKFVSLIDQYLNRFPLSFQYTDPAQKQTAQIPSKGQKGDKKPEQQPTAKPPTIRNDAEENTETENVSQQIQRSRKLTATDRRTIRRSLPVYVKAAKGKTSAPQRLDFLSRLAANPIKALSRSKNTAVIFKHPRLGDISAGSIRKAFDKKDLSGVSESADATKPSSKSETSAPESLFNRDSSSPKPKPAATTESKSPIPPATSEADQPVPKSEGAIKLTKPKKSKTAPLPKKPTSDVEQVTKPSKPVDQTAGFLVKIAETFKSEFPDKMPDLVHCTSGEFVSSWVPSTPEGFEMMNFHQLGSLTPSDAQKALDHFEKIRKCIDKQHKF